MVGKTERTLKRNIIDPLTEMLGPAPVPLVQGSGEVWLLGRRVYLAGANDERAQERIRGLTLAGAYVDEISTIPQSFWSMLLSRLSVEGARLFGTSNPDSPAHWLKAEFLDRASVWLGHDGVTDYDDDGMDLARFWFRLADNPHLPAAYVASLKQEFVGLWRKRFIDGLWVAAEGAVYDMFDVERHVVDMVPVIRRWLACSIDYGTVNPLHALLIGLGVDRRLYVVAEWRWDSRARLRQLTDAEYSAKLREWLASVRYPGSQLYGVTPERFIVDPSAASFIRQLHADHLPVMGADNAVLDGIRLTASLFGSGRLLISRSCKALIGELASYVWDDKARLCGEDKPLKLNDHGCLVAGTPVLAADGEKPIESIRPGEMVMTRRGLRPVLVAGLTSPAASTVRVTLSDGRMLEGTGNHPVWVAGKDWRRLDTLRYGDILETCQTSTSSDIRESVTDVTRTRTSGPNVVTTYPASGTGRSTGSAGSTRRSGRTITARYRKAATSTTRTMTRSTTTRRTSSVSTAMSTSGITLRKPTTGHLNDSRTLRRSALSLPRGTALPKVSRGIARTASGHGRAASRFRPSATSAASRSPQSPGAMMTASARTPASPSGGAQQVLMTSTAPAIGAGRPSGRTSTRAPRTAPVHVVAVAASPGPRVPVFNLSVADCPEYFAAGVLVHNCDSLRYGTRTTHQIWRNLIIPAEAPPNYEDHFGVAM